VSDESDPVVVLGAARTPFGSFGGALRDMSIPSLGAVAAAAALERSSVVGNEIEEFAMGVNLPGSDRSIARQTSLLTGVPDDRFAYTVDRACCSSLTAVAMARRGVLAGDATLALVGGAENLSMVPYYVHGLRFGQRLGDVVLRDQLVISCPHTGVPRAVQAADGADSYGIGREQQDDWALRSHHRAAAADASGFFATEIVAVVDGSGRPLLERDESIRPGTTIEKLASLVTVNGSSTVTAGNAPGLSTGAAFAVLARASTARARGSRPRAVIRGCAQVAGHPAKIASIPATAARAVLDRCRLTLADIDVIEINEAFAAVPLVTTLELAGGDRQHADRLRARTNVNGGAVALGHPTGATGVRLIMTAINQLTRRGGGRALVAMCGGIGEGEAVVLEVTDVEPSDQSS
jgi:acetyl-CoA C-acetyltransferase